MFLALWLSTPLALVPLGAFFQHSQAAPPTPPAPGGGVVLPPAPSDLRAHPCDHAVELRWHDNSPQETGFAVLRRAPNAPGFVEIGTTGPNETSFRDENVPDGTYRYRVLARALTGQDSPSTPAVRVTFPNQPPVITTDLPATLEGEFNDVHRFHVTVTDPEGDAVDLELLNPPFGVTFQPLHGAASPATVEGRWRLGEPAEIHERLRFASGCARLTVDVRRTGVQRGPRPLLGDVTGDGVPDAVVWNENPVYESKSPIGIYAGGSPSTSPVAVLDVASDPLAVNGGDDHWQFVQLEDVTGDGVLDIVSDSVSERVYVWAGGASLSGTPAPYATLVPSYPPDSASGVGGQVVQLVDIDRDGMLDVVSANARADAGARDTGAIYLWLGASTLVGTLAPTCTLTVPGAPAFAELGASGVGIADLTGDGMLDVYAVQTLGSEFGTVVWSGAAIVGGASAPTIQLVASSLASVPAPLLVADLTGDGVLDVIGLDYDADYGGVSHTGVMVLWNLAGASGALEPATTFYVPGAAPNDDLGIGGGAVRVADVTGDGRPDLLVPTAYASRNGQSQNGAIYVWLGNVASGVQPPDATLAVPGSASSDRLGLTMIDDWDQDGVLDLLSADVEADIGGLHDAGAVYLWKGGALSGDVAPSATLVSASPVADDLLGIGEHPLMLADMDGDGALDVLCGSYIADANGVADTGVVDIWPGSSLAGTVAAAATLAPTAAHARLTVGVGFQVADLDGDGKLDVIAGGADGKIYCWRAMPWQGIATPTAKLTGITEIGFGATSGGTAITLADLDGDGLLDVLASAPETSIGPNDAAGTVLVWHGRAWIGNVAAEAKLVAGAAHPYDGLSSFPDLPRVADLDGDGRLDVFAGTRSAESNVPGRYGATYFWSAAGAAVGTTTETAKLAP